MPITLQTYESLALEDADNQWELRDGRPLRKPDMTAAHNEIMMQFGYQLIDRLDRNEYRVRINASRVRFADHETYFVPDVMVVPTSAFLRQLENHGGLELYDMPLPFIVEIWSPSTGEYDVEKKLPRYQERGDREIWRIHPYERSMTRWIRQSVGEYMRQEHRHGPVLLSSLPNLEIDFEALFD
jgi:Uma2 family endonuclease